MTLHGTEKFCAGDDNGLLRFALGTGCRIFQGRANERGGLNVCLDSVNQTGNEPRLPGIKVGHLDFGDDSFLVSGQHDGFSVFDSQR